MAQQYINQTYSRPFQSPQRISENRVQVNSPKSKGDNHGDKERIDTKLNPVRNFQSPQRQSEDSMFNNYSSSKNTATLGSPKNRVSSKVPFIDTQIQNYLETQSQCKSQCNSQSSKHYFSSPQSKRTDKNNTKITNLCLSCFWKDQIKEKQKKSQHDQLIEQAYNDQFAEIEVRMQHFNRLKEENLKKLQKETIRDQQNQIFEKEQRKKEERERFIKVELPLLKSLQQEQLRKELVKEEERKNWATQLNKTLQFQMDEKQRKTQKERIIDQELTKYYLDYQEAIEERRPNPLKQKEFLNQTYVENWKNTISEKEEQKKQQFTLLRFQKLELEQRMNDELKKEQQKLENKKNLEKEALDFALEQKRIKLIDQKNREEQEKRVQKQLEECARIENQRSILVQQENQAEKRRFQDTLRSQIAEKQADFKEQKELDKRSKPLDFSATNPTVLVVNYENCDDCKQSFPSSYITKKYE